VGDETRGRDEDGWAEAEVIGEGEQDEDGEREQAAERADVVEPLAGVDAEASQKMAKAM